MLMPNLSALLPHGKGKLTMEAHPPTEPATAWIAESLMLILSLSIDSIVNVEQRVKVKGNETGSG